MLHCVCCFYNPCGYQRIKDNYWRFRESLGAPLTTVELSFTGDFEIDDAIQIRGTEQNVMWQKERLLNLGIESLPASVDKVAWIDADLLFLNPHWQEEAEKTLDEFPVCQLFQAVTDLDADCAQFRRLEGNAYANIKNPDCKEWKRPGGAWAARREVIEGGLADEHILGGSDSMMLQCWRGDLKHPLLKRISKAWKAYHLTYFAKVYPRVRNHIGYVRGDALHLFHGYPNNRNYVGRWKYLTDHDFDPQEDIEIDENGLWKWCSYKPLMHWKVKRYFRERDEDSV